MPCPSTHRESCSRGPSVIDMPSAVAFGKKEDETGIFIYNIHREHCYIYLVV